MMAVLEDPKLVVVKVVGTKYKLNLFNLKKSMYREVGPLVLVNVNLYSTESGKPLLMDVIMT